MKIILGGFWRLIEGNPAKLTDELMTCDIQANISLKDFEYEKFGFVSKRNNFKPICSLSPFRFAIKRERENSRGIIYFTNEILAEGQIGVIKANCNYLITSYFSNILSNAPAYFRISLVSLFKETSDYIVIGRLDKDPKDENRSCILLAADLDKNEPIRIVLNSKQFAEYSKDDFKQLIQMQKSRQT